MMQQTIKEIEDRLATATLSPERRQELVDLLDTLKQEVSSLAQTHREEARNIAGFAKASTEEATASEPNPENLELSLESLSSSVRGFEGSHPQLVEIVNRLAVTLSNLGI
jgi:hypothetical protein